MKLNELVKTTKRTQKRVGRGHGSGKGKTGGKGTKGQKARHSIKVGFEGGQTTILKRIPLKRGKARNKSFKSDYIIVNTKLINKFPANSIIDKDAIVKANLVDKKDADKFGLKILGNGEITNVYTLKLPCSKNVRKKIEKAGGKISHE